jgi:hypothetical protein
MDLLDATESGNIRRVQELLDSGVDINDYVNDYGMTALLLASMYEHIDIVRLLLEKGADVNIKDENGYNALMWASVRGYTDIVRLLLENGADINLQNENGYTALMLASVSGITEIVRLLLEKGADVNIRDEYGNATLSLALYHGYTDIVDLLKRHMGSTRIQSRFRGKRTRRKANTQKAEQGLSLGKALENQSTYSENIRYQPEIAEMISQRLSEMPYNPEVTRRMKEEDENERMADYLETMKKYGGRKKKKRKKKKKKTQKKKKKKKKKKKH